MEVYINAAELGISHLDTSEVAETVGLGPPSVRVLRARGFDRLQRLAREVGLIDSTFDLGELFGGDGGDHTDGDDERR
jgi:hypothetical protein